MSRISSPEKFPRLPKKVFSSSTASSCWDGTVRGKKVPVDVYAYTIIFSALNQQEVLIDSQMMISSSKVLKTCTISLTKKINDDLQKCETKRERKRYLDECEKVLRSQFESNLKNLSRKQGQYLIKLIDRETGHTVYDLLKEYRSGWKAFWWNFAGKFFQLNMKEGYDPTGEDREIENFPESWLRTSKVSSIF